PWAGGYGLCEGVHGQGAGGWHRRSRQFRQQAHRQALPGICRDLQLRPLRRADHGLLWSDHRNGSEISEADPRRGCRRTERGRAPGALFPAQGGKPQILLRGAGRSGAVAGGAHHARLSRSSRPGGHRQAGRHVRGASGPGGFSRRSEAGRIPEALYHDVGAQEPHLQPAQLHRRARQPAGRVRHFDRYTFDYRTVEEIDAVQTGYYVALSSQVALERRLNTLADNVANAGTVGYKAGEVTFDDVLTGLTAKAVSFVSPGADSYNIRAGALRETGNPFDFAVQGDAWFAVETEAGPMMTRDGHFTMRETGELVTLQGYPVLDPGGTPLV